MRRISVALVLLLALGAAVGCAKVPQEAVSSAKTALDGAKTAQADQYAPDAWTQAQDAQSQLDAELKAQEDKFALFRSYDHSKELAQQVQTKAQEATQAAEAAKERAREEATNLLAEAKSKLAELQTNLEKAPRGKGTAADLAALKSDASGIETSLTDAENAFNGGDFLTAKSKAEAALQSISEIQAQIDAARQAKRGRT